MQVQRIECKPYNHKPPFLGFVTNNISLEGSIIPSYLGLKYAFAILRITIIIIITSG